MEQEGRCLADAAGREELVEGEEEGDQKGVSGYDRRPSIGANSSPGGARMSFWIKVAWSREAGTTRAVLAAFAASLAYTERAGGFVRPCCSEWMT